ncbi:MAG: IreB family regulatory phosphoprotein [Clostridia bacterium]|nr:IreB family regulatory phosphoprotein [Clostridia bacterium]
MMQGKSNNFSSFISTPNTETRTYPSTADKDESIREILSAVYDALADKGYDPVNQIVGYILSEDPTYITNHKNARGLIRRFDRDELLDALARFYFNDKK